MAEAMSAGPEGGFILGTNCECTGRAERTNRDGEATYQEAPPTHGAGGVRKHGVIKALEPGIPSKTLNNGRDTATLEGD